MSDSTDLLSSPTPGEVPKSAASLQTEKPRIRVLIAADTFAPDVNGAARFAERLAAGLVARGHEVQIMAPAASRKHGSWSEMHEGHPIS